MRESNNWSREAQQGALGAALLALIAGWALLAWPWLSGRVTIPWDAKAQFLPQLQFLAASWGKGDSAAWAPYVFAGHPQIADPQSLIFSPPFALLAWLNPAPSAWAADATLYLTILVGAAAMLAWLNDKRWHPAAGVLAALSFAFGAAMAWRVQHIGQVLSLAYLPIVFLLLDRALDRRSVGYGIGAGLAAACLVLGRDQVALLCVYLLIAYVIWRLMGQRDGWKSALRSAAKPLSAAIVAGAILVALPLLMTALVAADSNRPAIDYEGAGRASLHPALFLTLLAPDVFGATGNTMSEYWGPPSDRWGPTGLFFAQNMGQLYLGALPALLLIWGAVSGVLWRRDVRLFALALVFMCVYALGWYTPVFRLMHAMLPGVDLFRRPADAVFLIGFLTSVLSGFALHVLLSEREARVARGPIIATALIAGSAFAFMIALAVSRSVIALAWPGIAIPLALSIAAGAVAVLARRLAGQSPALAVALIAAAMIGDLAWSNRPGGATGLPPETYAVLDPKNDNDTISLVKARLAASASDARRDRAEIVGFGFHWPNVALSREIETTLGYNPLRLAAYTRATGAGDHVGLPEQKNFSPLFPSYRSLLARMLGLSTIATSVPIEAVDKRLKPGDVTIVARTAEGYVYDNPGAFPRVFFATKAVAADFDALISSGAWPDVDYSSTVLLEKPDAPATGARRPGSVRILEYSNAAVTLEIDNPDGGWVILNDIWHPWWFATMDGAATPLLRANGLFRAVAAPPGRHSIKMTFEPVRGALGQFVDAFGLRSRLRDEAARAKND